MLIVCFPLLIIGMWGQIFKCIKNVWKLGDKKDELFNYHKENWEITFNQN